MEGGLSSDKLFVQGPEFLVTPLLMGPVSLISQGGFEEPPGEDVSNHPPPFQPTTVPWNVVSYSSEITVDLVCIS